MKPAIGDDYFQESEVVKGAQLITLALAAIGWGE